MGVLSKISTVCKKLILLFALACMLVITIVATVFLDDRAAYLQSNFGRPAIACMVVFAALIIFFNVFAVFRLIDRLGNRGQKVCVLILMLINAALGFLMIYGFNVTQMTDAFMVQDQAWAIVNHIDEGIDYDFSFYFNRYGNNNFFLLLCVIGFRLTKDIPLFQVRSIILFMNVICECLTVFMGYQIVKLVRNRKTAVKALVLFTIDPLHFLFLDWGYTCTLSIPIGVAIVLLALVIYRTPKMWVRCAAGAGEGLLVVFGYNLRPTSVIPFIAVVVMAVLCAGKWIPKARKLVLPMVLFVALLGGSFVGIKAGIETLHPDDSRNFPITHWIMMGLHEAGCVTPEDNAYTASFETKEEKVEANLKEIKRTLSEYSPLTFTLHCAKKLYMTFSSGSSDFGLRLSSDRYKGSAYYWLVEPKADLVILYCQAFRLFCCVAALWTLLRQLIHGKDNYIVLIALTLLGGMLFYILWEGKTCYSLPFLPFLYLLATDGTLHVSELVSRVPGKGMVGAGAGVMAISLILIIMNAGLFAVTPWEYNDYAVSTVNPTYNTLKLKDLSKSSVVLTQTFYSNKPFSAIKIRAIPIDNDSETTYLVELSCGEESLFEKEIGKADISEDGNVLLSFDFIYPDGKQEYQLRIISVTPGEQDSIRWRYKNSMVLDNYDGTLMIGEEEIVDNLVIHVFGSFYTPYMSRTAYAAISVLVLLDEAALVFAFLKKKRQTG